MLIDKQISKVYSWEQNYVFPKDKSVVFFNQIQSIVNYVWLNEGLQYPPVVKPINKRCTRVLACANRLHMFFPESVSTAIILHEIAHSLTMDAIGYGNAHGALFMGVYCDLLSKYLHLDLDKLISSAIIKGIKVKKNSKLEIF